MLVVSHWSLSDNKSPKVSRTLLSILADLNNAIVWMISTCPLISLSSSPFTSPLGFPNAPTPVIFMFHSFFCSLARSSFLSLFLLSFIFTLWSTRTAKTSIWHVHFSCLLSLGLVVWPRLGDLFVSQNPSEVCAFHFPGWILGYLYTFCSYGQIKIFAQFPVDYLPHIVMSILFLH